LYEIFIAHLLLQKYSLTSMRCKNIVIRTVAAYTQKVLKQALFSKKNFSPRECELQLRGTVKLFFLLKTSVN